MRKLPSFFALRAFESAARQVSFALAAKELHLTPSAISHQVHGLEAYFGKPLFDRLTRRVELTPDGIHNVLAKVTATDALVAIVDGLRKSSLLIADGHHRYETALHYRDEIHAATAGA